MSDYLNDGAEEAEEGEAEGDELPADPEDEDPGVSIEHSDGGRDQDDGGNQVPPGYVLCNKKWAACLILLGQDSTCNTDRIDARCSYKIHLKRKRRRTMNTI